MNQASQFQSTSDAPDASDAARPGPATLAVIVKGWPRLSETFIAQELAALEARDMSFEIWSLRHPSDKKSHALHDQVRAARRYLPEYLHRAPWRVFRGLLWGLTRRRFWPLLAVWLGDLARDRSVNRVRRFGQALVLARELPPQIRALYAHFLHTPASVTRYAAILRGLEWGFSAHAKDIWTSPEWEKREKIAAARFGATCTRFGAEHLRSIARSAEKIRLIYHGLDLCRFPPPPDRVARSNGALDGSFHMLSVGRLVEKKGFDRLIEALGLLPADLDWRWTHIGGGDLGPALKARAAALGLAERIDWRGASDQAEVIAAMRAADLFVLPSRIAENGDRDGLPNVLMEASSQKLAILSTPVGAIPEFIADGENGVLVEDSPAALAGMIGDLARAPRKRLELAEAAHARLIRDFGVEAGISELAGLLDDMLAPA